MVTVELRVLVYWLTYSGWSDAKLALSIYQAVLNDSKESRISICSTDTNYGGSQVHVLKHRLLQSQTSTHFGSGTPAERF